MNRLDKIKEIRHSLSKNELSVGSWIQIPSPSIAEVMGQAGYDWVAVDMEHGSIDVHQLPDIFRALELGGTLPLVRLAQGEIKECKQALAARVRWRELEGRRLRGLKLHVLHYAFSVSCFSSSLV